MEGTYNMCCFENGMIRLVYSDIRDTRYTRYIDMTEQMFEAIKSPFVGEMFWKWLNNSGELDTKDPRICYMGNNRKGDDVYRIAAPVENHFIYFARGEREGCSFARIYLEQILVNKGNTLEHMMDVTSFARLLLSKKSIKDLPSYLDTQSLSRFRRF